MLFKPLAEPERRNHPQGFKNSPPSKMSSLAPARIGQLPSPTTLWAPSPGSLTEGNALQTGLNFVLSLLRPCQARSVFPEALQELEGRG